MIWPVAILCSRLVLGALFLTAGIIKLVQPGPFAATLMAYQLLPIALLRPLALVLPWIEVLTGAYLLAGLFTRAAAGAALGLLAVFMVALGQAMARGLSLENCGCFGDLTTRVPALAPFLGGTAAGGGDLLRDAALAGLALVVILGPPSPFSVDRRLASQRPLEPLEPADNLEAPGSGGEPALAPDDRYASGVSRGL